MEERNSTGIVVTIIIVILIIIGLVWYFNRDTTDINITQPPGSIIVPVPTPVPTPTPGTSTTTGGGTTTTTERAFVITARNYSFSPSEIRVRRGDKVSITLASVAGTHDLKIDGYNVSTGMVNTGQSDVITFTADRAGSFEYYCSVLNHRSLGMKGMFIVE